MRILITAGPTWERIDAVRYIGNRSSGKVGLALAQAALQDGHEVTMLLGPGVNVDESLAAACIEHFESAADLQALLEAKFADHDVLIMAAAVADYRPVDVVEGKRPRQQAGESWSLRLEPTPDLVAALARRKKKGQQVIAFALEADETLTERATQKLIGKGVDAIVANPLQTIGADQIAPVWLTPDAAPEAPGCMTKVDFARWMLDKIAQLPC